jgi:hypothetical protein
LGWGFPRKRILGGRSINCAERSPCPLPEYRAREQREGTSYVETI